MATGKQRNNTDLDHGLVYVPLPAAVEFERAAIGVFLQHPEVFGEVREGLGDGACLRAVRLRLIYQIACELDDKSDQPDIRAVVDRLISLGRLNEAGGALFVFDLMKEVVPCSVPQYVKAVRKAHHRDQVARLLWSSRVKLTQGASPDTIVAEFSSEYETLSHLSDPSSGLRAETIDEILESSDNIQWLVQSIFPVRGIGIISGDGGVGKTWVGFDLSLAVAEGREWLGKFETQQCPVLFIDLEGTRNLVGDRLRLLGAEIADADRPLLVVHSQELLLDTSDGQAALRHVIRRHKPGLVIIDPLAEVHRLDENDASQMNGLLSAVRRITVDEECFVLFTHHTRKRTQHSNRLGESMRGSTAIKDKVDSHLTIRKVGADRILLHHEKSRYGLEVEPVEVTLPGSDRCGPLVASIPKQGEIEKTRNLIISYLQEASGWVERPTLEASCRRKGISKSTFGTAIGSVGKEDFISCKWIDAPTADKPNRKIKAFRIKEGTGTCDSDDPQCADFGRGAHPEPAPKASG